MTLQSLLGNVFLPLSLAIIMLGMGLSLEIKDFKSILATPKALLGGLLSQMVLLPIIGFCMVILFDLEPVYAVGFMIIAACPGGVTSNLITHVAKGDTALSISLTTVASFVTVITIPLIVSFSLDYFLGEAQTIELPILKTIAQIVVITILPVSIGMLIRQKFPDFSKRMEVPTRKASTIIFIIIVILLIAASDDPWGSIVLLGPMAFMLNIVTMFVGWGIAKVLQLSVPQTLSIIIESGLQNATLGMVIATTILMSMEMSLPSSVYGLVMFVSGGFMMAYFGRKKTKEDESVSESLLQ